MVLKGEENTRFFIPFPFKVFIFHTFKFNKIKKALFYLFFKYKVNNLKTERNMSTEDKGFTH